MPRRHVAALAAVLALAGGVAAWAIGGERDRPALGLFTSLPIYWNEAGSVGEALDGAAAPHWARTAMEARYRLVPLDALDAEDLDGMRELVMAQPRPLAPAENVALDAWVRRGGRVLLFADPLLTEHSRFVLGDKRRPQDMAVLSPILARWGVELRFDEDQPGGERIAAAGDVRVPVDYPGTLAARDGGFESRCRIADGGLAASCAVGKGRALIVADAAVLDREREDGGEAFGELLEAAFAD